MLADFKSGNVTVRFLVDFSILVFFEKDEVLNDDKQETLKENWQNYCDTL